MTPNFDASCMKAFKRKRILLLREGLLHCIPVDFPMSNESVSLFIATTTFHWITPTTKSGKMIQKKYKLKIYCKNNLAHVESMKWNSNFSVQTRQASYDQSFRMLLCLSRSMHVSSLTTPTVGAIGPLWEWVTPQRSSVQYRTVAQTAI
jgi:hypothetical protein